MFCIQCGNQVSPEARFCTVCGTAIVQAQELPSSVSTDPLEGWLGKSSLGQEELQAPRQKTETHGFKLYQNLTPLQTVLSLTGAALLIGLYIFNGLYIFDRSDNSTPEVSQSQSTESNSDQASEATSTAANTAAEEAQVFANQAATAAGMPVSGSTILPADSELVGQPVATATPYDTFNGGDAESFDSMDLHMDEDKHWVRLVSDNGQHFAYTLFDLNDSDKLIEQTCAAQQECQQIYNSWIGSDVNVDRPLGLMLCQSGKSICDVYPMTLKINAQTQGMSVQQLLNQYTSAGDTFPGSAQSSPQDNN